MRQVRIIFDLDPNDTPELALLKSLNKVAQGMLKEYVRIPAQQDLQERAEAAAQKEAA